MGRSALLLWWALVFGPLALDDLFLAGAGCEIAAGYLLAKGLLLNINEIRGISATFLDFNPLGIVARVKDRVTTKIALTALVFGFCLQAIGYLIDLSLPITGKPSVARALVGLGLVVAAIAIVLLTHRLLLPPLQRRTLIEMARYDSGGKRRDRPFGALLLAFGGDRWPARPDESQAAYGKRVWKVHDITEGGWQ